MNGTGKVLAIIAGGLGSLSMAGGLSYFIGTLAFAPIAVAGEVSRLEKMVEKLVDASVDTNEAVRQLATEMKLKRVEERVRKEEREEIRRRAFRNPREWPE